MPTILIVDDHDDMRLLVRSFVERSESGISVAGVATDGNEAIARWRELSPDVIVMDNRMPNLSGLDAARAILAESPGQAIILYTAFTDPAVTTEAEALGIRACLPKSDLDQLVRVISAVAQA